MGMKALANRNYYLNCNLRQAAQKLVRSLPRVAITVLHSLILYENRCSIPVACEPLLQVHREDPSVLPGASSPGQEKGRRATGRQDLRGMWSGQAAFCLQMCCIPKVSLQTLGLETGFIFLQRPFVHACFFSGSQYLLKGHHGRTENTRSDKALNVPQVGAVCT